MSKIYFELEVNAKYSPHDTFEDRIQRLKKWILLEFENYFYSNEHVKNVEVQYLEENTYSIHMMVEGWSHSDGYYRLQSAVNRKMDQNVNHLFNNQLVILHFLNNSYYHTSI